MASGSPSLTATERLWSPAGGLSVQASSPVSGNRPTAWTGFACRVLVSAWGDLSTAVELFWLGIQPPLRLRQTALHGRRMHCQRAYRWVGLLLATAYSSGWHLAVLAALPTALIGRKSRFLQRIEASYQRPALMARADMCSLGGGHSMVEKVPL